MRTFTEPEVNAILKTRDGKKRRFHVIARPPEGNIFAETAPIILRTLTSVGGMRGGCQHTKRKNSRARKLGFADFADQMAAKMRAMLNMARP